MTRRPLKKTVAELKDTLTKLRTGFDEIKLAVSGKLQPLGIIEIPETEVESLLETLRSRLKEWQEQVKQKTDIEKQIAAIDSEVKRLDAVIDTQVKALTEKQVTLERLKKELADGTEERKQLYGDKKPDDERRPTEQSHCLCRKSREESQRPEHRAATETDNGQDPY